MPGRVGIDFGTSNTVVAVWDGNRGEGIPLHIPDYGRPVHYRQGDKVIEEISVVAWRARIRGLDFDVSQSIDHQESAHVRRPEFAV